MYASCIVVSYVSYLPCYSFVQASLDFSSACKKDDIRDHFEDRFPLWARAIVTYCKETQVRSTALQIETFDYDDTATNDGEFI